MSSRRRPVRLRNACLNCTSAKVKCSGQKTGCDRCSKTDSECVYLESMAGRVPRNHKKQVSGTSDHAIGDNLPFTYFDIGAGSGATTPDDDSVRNRMHGQLPNAFSDRNLNGEENIGFFDVPFTGFGHLPSTSQTGIPTSPVSDFQARGLTAPIGSSPAFAYAGVPWSYVTSQDDTTSKSPVDASGSCLPPSHTQNGYSSFSSTVPTRESLDERCILAATQIINALESCIARPHELHVILKAIRKAGVGLNGLLDLQQNLERKSRCAILFRMILYQSLDLLEKVMGYLGANDGTRNTSITSPSPRTDITEGQLEHLDAINNQIASLISNVGCKEDAALRSTWARKVVEELSFGLETVGRVAVLTETPSLTNSRDLSEDVHVNRITIESLKMRFEKLQFLARKRI
ncbi:hypothetical protein GGR52DRAFT_534204 [Hypoxylon sp. FL1284]|nr:hypothetical protein GGR52DRAFT_534204 [Hypoxylon sp. FL1284]